MLRIFSISLALLLLLGCNPQNATPEQSSTDEMEETPEKPITEATAILQPTEGNAVMGTLTFHQMENGIHIMGEISGLTAGEHGFHVHEVGDCSAPDGTSAGGHFNPTNHDHAFPENNMRHVGDLGNITADESGIATLNFMDTKIGFSGENNIIGRGLIVHADPDDGISQPTGAAGARLACAVIEVSTGSE